MIHQEGVTFAWFERKTPVLRPSTPIESELLVWPPLGQRGQGPMSGWKSGERGAVSRFGRQSEPKSCNTSQVQEIKPK